MYALQKILHLTVISHSEIDFNFYNLSFFLNNERSGNALFARKMWLKFRNLFTHILVAAQHAKKKWNIWKKILSELELKVSGFLFSTQIIHYFMSLNSSQPNSKVLEYLVGFSSEGRKSAPLLFSIVKKD